MRLQEWSQKYLKILPQYTLVDETSDKNGNYFTMRVELMGFKTFEASGNSKKETEEELARIMMEYIDGQ
jgi:dsRNA-specific ribonuclease